MIDIDRVRQETPASNDLLHFNNAGASLMPDAVVDAVTGHLQLERRVGGYEAAQLAADKLQDFYLALAQLLGAGAHEIAYVENATRAWDMAFYGMPLHEGDRVLTHVSEYASNYLALMQQSRRRGFHIDVVPSDASGQVDIDAMVAMIGPRTRLIALTHVPTQGGLVNPARSVGRVAREHGLIYMLDACQSVGQIDLDVSEIGCHVLSGTGRKFLRGPRGTGFLYVAADLIERLDPPFIDLHSAVWSAENDFELAPGARRFENWESYVAGRIGLARAVRYALDLGLPAIETRVGLLAQTLRDALAGLPGVKVHDLGRHRCGIVTFTRHGEAPQDMARRLRERRINVSVTDMPSARLDLGARGLTALLRASPHYYNTEEEIARFVAAVDG